MGVILLSGGKSTRHSGALGTYFFLQKETYPWSQNRIVLPYQVRHSRFLFLDAVCHELFFTLLKRNDCMDSPWAAHIAR